MKHLILVSVILLSGCALFKGEVKKPVTITEAPQADAENSREVIADMLAQAFVYGAYLATIGFTICIVLRIGFGIPGTGHIAYVLAMMSAICFVGIWAIAWIPIVMPVVCVSLLAWGAHNIYKKHKEIKKQVDISEDLAIHFDDVDGNDKLKEDASKLQLIKRRLGVKKGG